MIRRAWAMRQRGNALLISLIIMASTLTISLGIAALVGSEVKTTGLLVPSERAYYKSESFVEQALWNKTKGPTAPNYQINNKGELGSGGYVCATAPCFQIDGRSTQNLLSRFSASTQPPNGTVSLEQDDPQQLDVGTATGSTLRVEFTGVAALAGQNQNPTGNYKGIEVTVVASPKQQADARNYVSTATGEITNTFIDKKIIPASASSQTYTFSGQNPLGETYPPADKYAYRLRMRSLGSDAQATVKAFVGTTEIPLYAPDYTTLAVTEDTKAQRGVQAVLPNVPEVLGIFDYVLFADMDLAKLAGKRPDGADSQNINVTVFNDVDCDGIQEAGEAGVGPTSIGLSGGPSDPQSADTTSGGTVTFSGLYTGTYRVSRDSLPSGYVACGAASKSVALAAGQTQNVQLSVRTQRVPLHQYWSAAFGNHYYTQVRNDAGYAPLGYAYEGIAGYIYATQVPGTVPVYEFYYGFLSGYNYNGAPLHDSYYSTSSASPGGGWQYIGIAGYMASYTGPNGYNANPNPYNGTCPNIAGASIPWYRMLNPTSNNAFDHYYSQGYVAVFGAYYYEGITSCLWTAE
jgi:hypothetical protein